LVAVVVESRRIDGQPRQHLLKYVGAIKPSEVTTLSERRRFWDRAAVVLAGFEDQERERLARALAARVPRPTAEEAGRGPVGIAAKIAAARARVQALRAEPAIHSKEHP
jgi:hypothetical protein